MSPAQLATMALQWVCTMLISSAIVNVPLDTQLYNWFCRTQLCPRTSWPLP
jgi:hypothetical protein